MRRASELNELDRLTDALQSFRCCLDEDIETFLQQKAMQFIKRNWCSVYLLLEEAAFDIGKLQIDAYFTLSHKTLIPESASKTSVKDVSGFKNAQSVHFVLIGQLGKYMERASGDTVSAASISSREILDCALDVVREASALIPCRCVLVECSENEKVQRVYTEYRFKFFQFDGEHYQFYKQI